jgi:hypothetical protein
MTLAPGGSQSELTKEAPWVATKISEDEIWRTCSSKLLVRFQETKSIRASMQLGAKPDAAARNSATALSIVLTASFRFVTCLPFSVGLSTSVMTTVLGLQPDAELREVTVLEISPLVFPL